MPLPHKKIYNLEEAREKIRRYCAYQERSQFQVNQRLKTYGLLPHVADELLVELIQDNFLNEQRFAEAFVRGKLNQKGWGRRKLEVELVKHRVSKPCIDKAISGLDSDNYTKKLASIAIKKWDSLQEETEFKRRQKVIRFLQGRGYFYDEIQVVLKTMDL